MPPKGHRHPAVESFRLIVDDDGERTQCLRCKTLLSGKIMSATDRTRRMQDHLASLKCRSTAAAIAGGPADASAALALTGSTFASGTTAGAAPLVVNPDAGASARPVAHTAPTLDNFCIRWTPEQDAQAQEYQVRWMCATGLPFHVFDHPEFAVWVSKLNPAATPASDYVLRQRLLPALYEKERGKLSHFIRGRLVHLQADGVTDNVHESSFCVTVVVDGAAYFYGLFPNDGESQDAQYYASKLQEVFDDIRAQGGVVASLTMDNTGMTAVRCPCDLMQLCDRLLFVVYYCGTQR
jgi:hypothetical protein